MSKIAIFVSVVALGFVLNHWLRNSYPWSVHGTIRGIAFAFWSVIAIVYLAKDVHPDQTLSTQLALALLSAALGFILGDATPLSMVPFHTSSPDQKDPALAKSAQEETEAMHNKLADIIKGGEPNEHNGYQARAFPNRRLEVAFPVNNCFTATERQRCDKVRKDVLRLLQPAKPGDVEHWRDWPELVEVARTVTKAELSDSQLKVNLFAAMQMIVMKTMLKVLFDESPVDTTKNSQIRKLAEDVNRQWQDSKRGLVLGEVPEWDFEQQGSMKATAEEIFGPWDDNNENNPFNKILPGYETMWRVVLRCILELSSSRHPPADTEAWKERLTSFIANPTKKQLQEGKNDAGLTAEHVSFEILRLYPPTRHVAREEKHPETGAVRPLTADIEELHHTAPVWGKDPKSFRPERWIVLTEGVNTAGFMPFGEKPFRCPARETQDEYIPFGVTMIAVLTGCFIEAMAGKWRLDEQGIPSVSQPMSNGRDDYNKISLLRIKSDAADTTSNVVDEPKKEKTSVEDTDAGKIDAQESDTEKIDSDNPVTDNTVTDDIAIDNTAATTDITAVGHPVADDTATDNTATATSIATAGDFVAGDTDASDINVDKTDDNKTDAEAGTELSETFGSNGEDENQTNAVQ